MITDVVFDTPIGAEIRPVSQPRISAATSISEADLLRQIRTKEKSETYGELFQADSNIHVEPLSGETWQVELTFNSHHCSWDYAWKSNRWSGPQEQHVVDIIVLKTASASEHRVVSSKPSSPFVVSSSHKKPQKTGQVKGEGEDETICLPAKGKNASRTVVGTVDDDDDDDERIQFTNTKLNYNHTVRPPTRELRCSDDKTEFIFTPCQPQGVAEESAAATLMMLMSGASDKKPTAAASSDAAAAPTSRKEKKPSSPEKKPPPKRSRTGDVPVPQQLMDLRMSYPYPYLYPVGPGGGPVSSAGEGFPPLWGGYPYAAAGTNFAPPLPFPYPYLLSQPPGLHYMYHCPDPRQPYLPPGHNAALSSPSESEGMEEEMEEGDDREAHPVQEVAAAVVGDDSDGSPTSSARHIPIAIAQPVASAVSAGPTGERRTAKSAKRAPSPSLAGPNGSRDVLHTAWDGVIRTAPTVPHVPSLRTTVSENRATSSSDEPRGNARSFPKVETGV